MRAAASAALLLLLTANVSSQSIECVVTEVIPVL
jgi:hypothetical protein